MTAPEIIYSIGGNGVTYGNTEGICRITGKQSTGILFDKWVKDTFTDIASLKPGSIISNEAAFCFDEASTLIQQLTGKEKPQRFRTYSHLVANNKWYIATKADKRLIYDIVVNQSPDIVCLSDSGQKHLLFKNIPGFWQLENEIIPPNIPLFIHLHTVFSNLLALGFSQGEAISGNYMHYRIGKAGVAQWKEQEDKLKKHRGSPIFDFTAFLMFNENE